MGSTERAKVAVSIVFVLNGLAFASWVSRVPAIRDGLDLTPGRIGLLLLCLSAGTAVALPLSGAVVGRLGPARTVAVSSVVVAAGLVVMALGLGAASVPLVALGMLGYGVGTSSWDVAMNVEAADVERRLGRTIMPRFHAGFSAGTVTGALVGAACARAGVGLPAQLVGTVVVVLAVVPLTTRSFTPVVPVHEDDEQAPGVLAALARAAHPDDRPRGAGLRACGGNRQRLGGARPRRRVRRHTSPSRRPGSPCSSAP